VFGELLVARINARFVAAGVGDAGLQIVRHDALRHATEKCQGALV
jgi:hypothetical protein